MLSTPSRGYALIDCNNFFVSCERVFKPHLNHVPVAVLSTNDGCFIARSKEVKALGIPMGAPLFQYQQIIKKHNVVLFSSNFKLYGDFSDRVMQIIGDFNPDAEIYSIDEAFVPITVQTASDFFELRKKIYRWTSIPVSVGIAPTKTLAKLANYIAKAEEKGLYSLMDFDDLDPLLKKVSIGEVWGIGRRSAEKLKTYRIQTAYDFIQMPEHWIRKKMGLLGLKTYLELKGLSCEAVDLQDAQRKSLVYSKSFGQPVVSLEHLKEAVVHYAVKAAEKIRRTGYQAQLFSLYLKGKEQSFYQSACLNYPSSSSLVYTDAALHLLQKMYREGVYLKAGIHLHDLSLQNQTQLSLFENEDPRHLKLMNTMDQINQKYGQSSLFFASEGLSKSWTFKRERLSLEYTTKWSDIPVFKI